MPQTLLRYDSGWNTFVTYAIAYDMLFSPAGSPLALLSPMDITNIVRSTMARLGEDPALYRGRSLRHGCVTAGFEAHLEEYLVYLQTGHRGLGGPSAVPAGRLYAMLTDPAAVYALFRVFRL